MDIRERPDGLIELDWHPEESTGPYVTLTKAQWLMLLAEVRELPR